MKDSRFDGAKMGMYCWGTVTAIVAASIVLVVVTGQPAALLARIKDAETVLGAIVAASALAWSHFFKAAGQAIGPPEA